MISNKGKEAIQRMIFDLAYQIEQKLSETDFFHARIMDIPPDEVSDVALQVAIIKVKEDFGLKPKKRIYRRWEIDRIYNTIEEKSNTTD